MEIPGGVLIPEDACNYSAEVWRRGLKQLRSDGLRDVPIAVLELLAELERGARQHAARRVTPNVTAVTSDLTPCGTIDPVNEVDTATAARILKVKVRAVAAKCRRRTLPARMVDGRWLIRREYLAELEENR